LQLSEHVDEHAAAGAIPEQNIVAPHDMFDAA
jgi:hypothetical protein